MTLRGYEAILPGAANRVFELAEGEQKATNEVRLRMAKGEQFATVASSIIVPMVQVLSIAATVHLALEGQPGVATLTSTPFVTLAITQLTIRFRKRDD